MNMVEKIRDEQVPVAVLKKFESEFGPLKNDIKGGAWYAHFEHTADATPANPGRSKAIPLHYSYKGKLGEKKVAFEFTPEGKLVHAKGFDDNNRNKNYYRKGLEGSIFWGRYGYNLKRPSFLFWSHEMTKIIIIPWLESYNHNP